MPPEYAAEYRRSYDQYVRNRDLDRDKLDPPFLTSHVPHKPGAYTGVHSEAHAKIHSQGDDYIARNARIAHAGVDTVALNLYQNPSLRLNQKTVRTRMLHEYVPTAAERLLRAEVTDLAPHAQPFEREVIPALRQVTFDTYEEDKLLRRIRHRKGGKGGNLIIEPSGAAFHRAARSKPNGAMSQAQRRNVELSEENRRLKQILERKGVTP